MFQPEVRINESKPAPQERLYRCDVCRYSGSSLDVQVADRVRFCIAALHGGLRDGAQPLRAPAIEQGDDAPAPGVRQKAGNARYLSLHSLHFYCPPNAI